MKTAVESSFCAVTDSKSRRTHGRKAYFRGVLLQFCRRSAAGTCAVPAASPWAPSCWGRGERTRPAGRPRTSSPPGRTSRGSCSARCRGCGARRHTPGRTRAPQSPPTRQSSTCTRSGLDPTAERNERSRLITRRNTWPVTTADFLLR